MERGLREGKGGFSPSFFFKIPNPIILLQLYGRTVIGFEILKKEDGEGSERR